MKVKCDYCGNYMDDTQEKCIACGAVNANYHRSANDTPKTIEELSKWYKDRNLPEPEVTRFFIGVNYEGPKAFGIYRDTNGDFVVYKNKADGLRAIRYRGSDEAYAVNELYLRLKEEILNQKSQNINRQSAQPSYPSKQYAPGSRHRKSREMRLVEFFTVFGVFGAIALVGIILNIAKTTGPQTYHYYYNAVTDDLYYCDGDQIWWEFDFANKDWNTVAVNRFPANINHRNKANGVSSLQLSYKDRFTNMEDVIDIRKSKKYIDAGHHFQPSTNSYYVYKDNVYYYLNDSHSSYGSQNNSGWYIYEDDGWNYYCDYKDRDKLDDELWYSPDDYSAGETYKDFYELTDREKAGWVTDFKDTSFYASYTENEAAYDTYIEQRNSSSSYSSNDSSYNWDSGSSWDSGSTNWDSDW